MKYFPLESSRADPLDDFLVVMAAMFYPDDQNKMDQYIAKVRSFRWLRFVEASMQDKGGFTLFEIPINELRISLGSPALEEFTEEQKVLHRQVEIAGNVLFSLFLMSQSKNIKEPSVRKAVYFLQKKYSMSEITIRKHWEKYKNISHVCASHVLHFHCLQENVGQNFDDSKFVINEFFGVSEFLRQFLEMFTPSRNQPPLVTIEDVWRFPEDYTVQDSPLDVPVETIEEFEPYFGTYSKRQYEERKDDPSLFPTFICAPIPLRKEPSLLKRRG